MEDCRLICTNCSKSYKRETYDFRCEVCKEPLELETVKKGKISEGNILQQNIIERYIEFYPYFNIDNVKSLKEGFTPLIKNEKLANKYNIKNLFFKNESQNPTWSFKDRGTLTGLLRARALSYKKIGTVSTGNMATSVAAYGAMYNMDTYILVKDTIADEKLKPIAIYGPHLIKVKGDYDELYSESMEIGKENDIYFINSDVPFRVEGYKTIAFEICEQLNFNIPEYIIVATSAGGNIRGIEKGFREFKNSGIIDKIPKFIAVQSKGCSPIYEAFKEDKKVIKRFDNPITIGQAIENTYPPSGNQVLRMIYENGGQVVAINEKEILDAQAEMAEIGIFGQPASATSLAAVKKLDGENFFKPEDSVVCIVTGSGLKYTKALDEHKLEINTSDIKELNNIIKNLDIKDKG